MIDLESPATALKDILGLTCEPVVVKFLKRAEALDGFDLLSERRYCQAVMGAKKGQKLLLAVDNISCVATFAGTEDWALENPEGKPLQDVRRIRDKVRARAEQLLWRMEL